MKPRVATVLSARDWEPNLVSAAQTTAAIKLIGRVYQPDEVIELNPDVVVVGSETSWVGPARIRIWKQAGIRVIGVFPAGDRPARDMLQQAGVDEAVSDSIETEALIRHIQSIPRGRRREVQDLGQLIIVGGARGGPGRTETAVSLAEIWGSDRSVLLIDLDQEGPGIAIRLGLDPRPDLRDQVEHVRSRGKLDQAALATSSSFQVLVGSHRADPTVVPDSHVDEVIDAALAEFEVVVCDVGPGLAADMVFKRADHAVLVADASATGLVRASRMVAEWAGPPPALVINRASRQAEGVVSAARKWTGLEPAAVVREHPRIREAARRAESPDRYLLRMLAKLQVPA